MYIGQLFRHLKGHFFYRLLIKGKKRTRHTVEKDRPKKKNNNGTSKNTLQKCVYHSRSKYIKKTESKMDRFFHTTPKMVVKNGKNRI